MTMTESEEQEYRERFADIITELSGAINDRYLNIRLLQPNMEIGNLLQELKDKDLSNELKFIRQYAMCITTLWVTTAKLSIMDMDEDTFKLIDSAINGLEIIKLCKSDLKRAEMLAEAITRGQN